MTGILFRNPEYTLEVASNPPTNEYFEAIIAPEGPWALLNPNSMHFESPATSFIRVAFVHSKVGKLVKFKIGVSISCNSANGPSSLSNGWSGKTISPSAAPNTFIDLQSSYSR